jgi:hypothetical protein
MSTYASCLQSTSGSVYQSPTRHYYTSYSEACLLGRTELTVIEPDTGSLHDSKLSDYRIKPIAIQNCNSLLYASAYAQAEEKRVAWFKNGLEARVHAQVPCLSMQAFVNHSLSQRT